MIRNRLPLKPLRSARANAAVLIALLTAVLWSPGAAAGAETAEAGVRFFGAPAGAESSTAPAIAAEEPATNAAPYRREALRHWTAEDANPEAPLRFTLLLPDRPVGIELVVRVDGEPLQSAYERELEWLLSQMPGGEPQASGEAIGGRFRGRLLRYVDATGRTPDEDEMRWLMERWGGGPAVLTPRERLRSARSGDARVFNALDADQDQVLDQDEVAGAADRLVQVAKAGWDDIVQASAFRPDVLRDRWSAWQPDPILVAHHEWDASRDARTSLYGAEGADDTAVPELRVEVHFDTGVPVRSTLKVTALDPRVMHMTSRQDVVEMRIADATLVISTGQAANADGELSLVADSNGEPLLTLLDSDADGRLSLRERLAVHERLAELDRNKDRRIDSAEVPQTAYLALGLGPVAHLQLGRREAPPQTIRADAPDWFVRMDANGDLDISRREFLGTSDQFDAIDANGDDLVSVAEARRAAADSSDDPATQDP